MGFCFSRINRFNLILLLMSFLVVSCNNSKKTIYSGDCPVIDLAPVEAELKLSDICDGYKIFTLKGKPLRMGVHYKVGEKVIAAGTNLFDLKGNYLTTLGRVGRGPGEYLPGSFRNIVLNENTVDLYSSNKKMTFNMAGNLLNEKIYNISLGKFWNYRGYYNIDDEYLLLYNEDGILLKDPTAEFPEPQYKFWCYSLKEDKFTDSFTLVDKKKIFRYKSYIDGTHCTLYKYKDTVRYHRIDTVYNVINKTLKPAYIYDKGKYKGIVHPPYNSSGKEIDRFEYISNKIYRITQVKENDRFLICYYEYKKKRMISVYDKIKRTNKNIDRITDDLVFMKKGPYAVSWNGIKRYSPKPEFLGAYCEVLTDKYLYYSVTPGSFIKAIKDLKKRFTIKDWNRYKNTHKDVIETFKNITEESNDIIIGYRFKK